MSDQSENLARRIRAALGEFDDPNVPVADLVRDLAQCLRKSAPQPPSGGEVVACDCPAMQVCDKCAGPPAQAVWLMPIATMEPQDSNLQRMAWGRSNLSTGQMAHAYDCIVSAAQDCGQTTQPPSGGERREREADRARFIDPAFNEWLDTGISDAGHTVWDAVGDTQAAWAGWEARQFAGDAVLIAECCGREECGGECGNEWLGMGMYRKPSDDLTAPPSAPVGVGGVSALPGEQVTMTWAQYAELRALAQQPAANSAAKHWHDLYRAECLRRQDDAARYGQQIADLEARQPAAMECPHRTRCDCLAACKYGYAGALALAAQPGGSDNDR